MIAPASFPAAPSTCLVLTPLHPAARCVVVLAAILTSWRNYAARASPRSDLSICACLRSAVYLSKRQIV